MTHIRSLHGERLLLFAIFNVMAYSVTIAPKIETASVEEEEVDWNEDNDPRAVQPMKKGETP